MGFKNMKRDDHGHVISNDETDGQKCQHQSGAPSAQAVEDQKYNKEMKATQEQNADMSEAFDDDYEEEFVDRDEKVSMDIKEYFTDKQLDDVKRYCDKYEVDFEKAKDRLAEIYNKGLSEKMSSRDAADMAYETVTDDIVAGGFDDEFEDTGAGDPEFMKRAQEEADRLLYNREMQKAQEQNAAMSEGAEQSYKSKYDPEDFEDARFYPSKSTMDENNRWIGRYHSMTDAHGLKGWNDENVKHVGDYNGTAMFQLPDGYYSINPNITSMSFKTKEALQNYLDRKNPEEHKYGVYFKPGDETQYIYRGKGDDGKEYDMEGPDAYKAARKNKGPLKDGTDVYGSQTNEYNYKHPGHYNKDGSWKPSNHETKEWAPKYFGVYEKRNPAGIGYTEKEYKGDFPSLEEAKEFASKYKGNNELMIGEFENQGNGGYRNINNQKYVKPMTKEQRQAIREQINKMVASLDDARSLDEAWDIEEGIKELEDMLKKYKGK